MSENLPEIGFKEKKEKKRGIGGWLRQRLGFGSRGGAMGEAGINPSAMNAAKFGRAAFGAGKLGASSAGGFAGLLAGKAGMLITAALVAVAGGMYVARNSPTAPSTGSSAFSSGQSKDNYVPAILRNQAANQGSSLDMFKETNKGAVSMEEAPAKPAGPPKDAAPKDASGEEPQTAEPAPPGGDNMAQDMMAKLQGGNMASLTSQLGGGSNNMSNFGGFSNKYGQGSMGPKTGFTSGIGAGFSSMPKFDQRKSKMLAMKGGARPVFGGAKAGSKGTIGKGAFNQAKGMRAIQKSYTGNSIDGARSTQDKAWEGTTGEGDASGGAGLSDGGAGIVTSPSLDNADGMHGGGALGNGTDPGTPTTPDVPKDVSPWADLLAQSMQSLLMAALLAYIGGKLCKIGLDGMKKSSFWPFIGYLIVYIIGAVMCLYALKLSVDALNNGMSLINDYGQKLLGTAYVIGGVMGIINSIMGLMGQTQGVAGFTMGWMSAVMAMIGAVGGMMGGK
ncbi:MAG: hypothetical protein M0011_11070 [Elusimicrobia bacterium]|nr:hypothetical protein [Elusimicrobiota bacterium]